MQVHSETLLRVYNILSASDCHVMQEDKSTSCGLLMQSNKDNTVVTVYIWSDMCLGQHADNGTSIQHNAVHSAVTSSQ